MNASSEKLKINRTRKRIYEMQQEDVPEMAPLQETAAVPALAVSEGAALSDIAGETLSGGSNEPVPGEQLSMVLREDAPVMENQQGPVTELVAAEPEMAVAAAAPDAITAAGSSEKEREEQEIHDLLHKMLQDDEPDDVPESDTPASKSAVEPEGFDTAACASDGSYEPAPEEKDELFQSAIATVYRYSAVSAATGLIPLPLVDMAGFMATQLLMLRKLSELYNIPFDSQRSKSSIAILASGINSAYLAASSSKLVPFIGAFSIAAMPAVNGALSYAVGRVFIQHFASGGTFLDFDPDKVRSYFEEQFRAGKMGRSGKPHDITR